MIPLIAIVAGIETVFLGEDLAKAQDPTGAGIAVFGVFAAITIVGMVLCWLSRNEE